MRFITKSRLAAAAKPMIGEINSDKPTSVALVQLTPLMLPWVIKLFASPTPRIEPIRVCELETGSPYHQVPRFQIMPASKSEITITTERAEEL